MRLLAPLDRWPAPYAQTEIAAYWRFEPDLFVSHALIERGTAAAVDEINDQIDACIEHFDGSLRVFHDWRRVRGYEKGCRARWMTRIRRRPTGYATAAHIVIPDVPILRMAVSGINLFLATQSYRAGLQLHSRVEAAIEAIGDPLPR